MITKNKEILMNYLDELYEDARCELNYQKDYELLIAVVLSAQCTDKRVNQVTKELFQKYTLEEISQLDLKEIEQIIRPVGTFTRKSIYIKEIANALLKDWNGTVPNNRSYLEKLPGVGHKTCNLVLSNLYDVPAFAVDTHVSRVSKRLKLVKETDNVTIIEKKLTKLFPKEKWSRLHHQMVLFGRYKCKSIKPECETCQLKEYCHYNKKR
ncbi:MAG: endonuclease III [Bacilli bacterium]|jgi:endonuclease-3|nr:endonuclease III [Bacilli bacterium]